MSRIGKNPIVVPKGVEVKFDNNRITVKGSNERLLFTFEVNIINF